MNELNNIAAKVSTLFKKYGLKSLTMDDIAHSLCISKKTLYQQVPEKSRLIEEVLDLDYKNYSNQVQNVLQAEDDALLKLIRLNGLLYRFLNEFSPVMSKDLEKFETGLYNKYKNLYIEMFLSAIKENMQMGKDEGVYREDINVEVLSKLHLARLVQIPESDIFPPQEFTSPAFVKEICLYHVNGLINDEGRKKLDTYKEEIENIIKS